MVDHLPGCASSVPGYRCDCAGPWPPARMDFGPDRPKLADAARREAIRKINASNPPSEP